MPAKQTVFIKINDDQVVRLKVAAGAYNDALLEKIGYLKPTSTGRPPVGYGQIGNSRADAIENGAIVVSVVYTNPTTQKDQTTKILFSPANTTNGILSQFVGQSYSGKAITLARMPRRIRYTY
jgi:hypothetical protein